MLHPAFETVSAPARYKCMIRSIIALVALTIPAAALAASPLEGNWTNPKRSVTVRIAPCAQGMCGRVVSASPEARDDAAAAGTPRLIGTELMSGLEQIGQGEWQGSVFVPDRNVRAEGKFRLMSATRLVVEGCTLGGFLCKEQLWTRVAAAKPKQRRRGS